MSEPSRTLGQLAEKVEDAIGFEEFDARKSGVRTINAVPRDLPPIYVDCIMTEQTALNLVKHGIEAMRSTRPGGANGIFRRSSLVWLTESESFRVAAYESAEAFLTAWT